MEKNVLLEKIVSNPTDTSWAQAYSTLNLYIVLSMRQEEPAEPIVTAGKELFEKLQREYFSLDEKNLANIKKSVEAALEGVADRKSVSIVLATISGGILYIIIAGLGSVILRRGEKVGPVAQGELEQIAAFSGEIKPDDVIILETEGFAQKVPVSKLSSTLDNLSVAEISETIAPFIHDAPTGTEAAIILQYKALGNERNSVPDVVESEEESEPDENQETETPKTNLDNLQDQEDVFETPPQQSGPKFSLPKLPSFGAKKMIVLVIIILVIVFAGSIYVEKQRQENAKLDTQLSQILDPEQKKFDEANSLLSLNKGLALDEFNTIQNDLSGKTGAFPQGTAQRKKLEEFIGLVQGKIGELSSGSTLSNEQVIFDKGADLAVFKNGTLAVVKTDTGEVNILDSSGKPTKTVETKNTNAKAVGADDNTIYIFGDSGITATTEKSGKTTTAAKDAKNVFSLDTFGANLYALNSNTKTVDKYVDDSSPRSDYFKGSITLNNPTSMSIDGSIWIIDNGKIRKFTKGTEDTFTVSGVTKDISSAAQIMTDANDTNVYVMDPSTTRIISISKSDGTVKNQYVSKDLASATSFTVDESGKKIYVVISGKLYSFDL